MAGIVGIGECVVDFMPGEGRAGDLGLAYTAYPGGSVANLCVVAARMGVESAFVGAVGEDGFGRYLKNTLNAFGVETGGMIFSRECGTGLIFVAMAGDGEREYSYANIPGADKMLHLNQVDPALLEQADVWHFSSNACSTGPTLEAQRSLFRLARDNGKAVSFDVNFRENNHASPVEALRTIGEFAGLATIVKATEEELVLVTGCRESRGADWLLARNAQIVLVTKGAGGVDYYSRRGSGHVDARRVDVVDTTGAGDNFLGGFLAALLEDGGLDECSAGSVERAAVFGNLVASLSITRWGAMTSVPTRAEVDGLL